MKWYVKYGVVLSIITGIILFSGMWDNFSAWADDGICDPGDPENLLTIFYGGENGTQVPDEDEIDPGAFTMTHLPMRLVICKPEVSDASPEEMVTLDVVAGKKKVILLDQAQENEIPTSHPFPLAELPALVWVKLTQSSEEEQDIRICAKFQKECQDFVTATALLNLEAHWPGTLDDPGEIVSEAEEDNSLNLIGSVNDDDDNDDDIIDNDREQSPNIVAEDDDVMTFLVKKLGPEQSSSDEPVFQEGTLELFAGDGLHFFTVDGTQELTLPLSVDLANPSGPLANILDEDVPLLVEANIPVERTMVELIYSQNGKELARDEVHLKVVQPMIKGGFHRGSVRYSEAMQLGADWVVCREFDETHPLSVFLLADPVYQNMKYKRQGAAAYTHEGWRVGLSYFEQLAARWNVFLDAVPFVPKYEAETLLKQFCEATGVPEDIAKTEGFVTDPDDPITESGIYDIRLSPIDQNKDMFKDLQVKVIKPGQIDGWFRIIGDVNDPYFLEEALTEVPEEDDIFFRTLGGMRVHLNVELSNKFKQYEHYLIGYEWFVAQDAEFTFTEASFEALNKELEDNGVPAGLRNRLKDLLENESFSTENDLMVAIQPAFEGYTITDQTLQAFQKYVDENRFPDYFLKDTGFTGAVFVDDQGEEHGLTNYTFEDAETFTTALRNAKVDGKPHKYAVHGYRVTKQALYFLKQDLPLHMYQKLSRLEKDTTLCDDDVPNACIRGTAGEGYSFRNVDDTGEFHQFITALNKALDGEVLTPEHYEIIKIHTDHVEQFGPIIQSYAGHWRYYQLCRDAIAKHGTIKPGQIFSNYRTTLDDFTLTDYALERLKDAGMPENLINTLENNLKNQKFTTEHAFLDAVKGTIGEEPTNTYKGALLNYAKEAPPLTDEELKETRTSVETLITRQDVYWQGEYRPDLDETITFSVILGKKKDLGEFDVIGTVPITRQIKSRVLELKNPPITGDDVSMLQAVLRSLGEAKLTSTVAMQKAAGIPKNQRKNDPPPGYRGTPVELDSQFGSGTNGAVGRFQYQNELTADGVVTQEFWPGEIGENTSLIAPVGLEMLDKIQEHWKDYLAAFEAYPDFPLIKPSIDAQLHNTQDIQTEYGTNWLERATIELAGTYNDDFAQAVQNCQDQVTCHAARKHLLDAWVKQEGGVGHWGYKSPHANDTPFSTVLGGADEMGSIGFSQIQARHKYGARSRSLQFTDLNLYHPADGIRGFVKFSNEYALRYNGGAGFFFAFQQPAAKSGSFHKTISYPANVYPRLAPGHLQNNAYTDAPADRLSKGFMAYNKGSYVRNRPRNDPTHIEVLMTETWPEMLRKYHPHYHDPNSAYHFLKTVHEGIAYALTIKRRAGLLNDAQGNPLRAWTWHVQVITTGADGICQTAREGDDIQVVNENSGDVNKPHAVAVIGGIPGIPGTNETLDTNVKVCFSDTDYTNFLNQYALENDIIEPFVSRSDHTVCFDLGNLSDEARTALGAPVVTELTGRNDDQIEVVEFTYSEADWYGANNGQDGTSWIEKLQDAQGGE